MNQIHLELAESELLCTQMPEPEHWLSSSELQRLSRLKAPKRRAHYLAGHWLARQLLAMACRGDRQLAAQFPLRECADKAPVPDTAEASAWQLSISHSGPWVACGIAPFTLGIDLEQRRARPSLQSMRHLLSLDAECAEFVSDDELLRRWVAKESWIKLHQGSALPEQLQAIELQTRSAEPADIRVLSSADWHLGVACAAQINVEQAVGYAGAWGYFDVAT